MIVAVDFDGTLCDDKYPKIGYPNRSLIANLIRWQKAGDKIILWTCRQNKELSAAVASCEEWGLKFDAVNENLPEVIEQYGTNCRKIAADLYIDDRSITPFLYMINENNHEIYHRKKRNPIYDYGQAVSLAIDKSKKYEALATTIFDNTFVDMLRASSGGDNE